METKLESACFLIADISGYTSFLADVELDHAQDIIADVMDTVVRCLRPLFRLAKFEGDAAFLFTISHRVDGSMIQDAIDSAYFAFRRRLRSIKQASVCECSACSRMQDLDLKFVTHHGEFIRHRMAGREELAGRDIIIVHRLLKNTAKERLGGHAYALFSDAFIQSAGIDAAAQGLIEHRETIDIIGEVKCWVRDLQDAWVRETDSNRTEVMRDKAFMLMEFEIDAPRTTVWEYFTAPGLRLTWMEADDLRETTEGGRRGTGTVNHCMHGPDQIIEEVIDWRPFDYLTLNIQMPMPGAPKLLVTYAFSQGVDPTGAGSATHVDIRLARPKPKDMPFVEGIAPYIRETFARRVEVLRGVLAERGPAPSPVEEPTMPVSAKRFPARPMGVE